MKIKEIVTKVAEWFKEEEDRYLREEINIILK
jgi:hypothetical protein